MSYCAQLSHFGAIKFTGPEAEKYLQGQITSDITLITEDKVQLSCQCDSKGKTHSTFYIVKDQEDYLLVGYKDSLKLSLAALVCAVAQPRLALIGFDHKSVVAFGAALLFLA